MHGFGVDHVEGGLSEISSGMMKVAEEHGAKFFFDTPVKQVITDAKKNATGLLLENGTTVEAEAVVLNADFGISFDD